MQPVALNRSEDYLSAFTEWKTSRRRELVLRVFKDIYEASFFGNGDIRCDILRQPQYSMLVLHHSDDFFDDDFSFLMDHIQEVLLGLGYYNYMSDSKVATLDGGLKQRIERHYLKPNFVGYVPDSSQFDRKYGNVMVEVFFETEGPTILKLTCNYYYSPQMQREKGIDKLMEEVLRII